jgi:hypothetical protein
MVNFSFSQTATSLNGNWSYEYNETDQQLGRIYFSSTLAIREGNYMLYQERISEHARHWDYCEIGRIVILENEIQLFPEAEGGADV